MEWGGVMVIIVCAMRPSGRLSLLFVGFESEWEFLGLCEETALMAVVRYVSASARDTYLGIRIDIVLRLSAIETILIVEYPYYVTQVEWLPTHPGFGILQVYT